MEKKTKKPVEKKVNKKDPKLEKPKIKKEVEKVKKESVESKPIELPEEKTKIVEILDIDSAIKELRKGEKRKFVQTLDLIVNLQKFDARKDSINSVIQVPNGYEKRIGAFLTKTIPGVNVILKDSFDNYKTLRDTKRLAKKYDLFISHASLMGQVATKFGRALGPSGKMPSPQLGLIVKEDKESIEELIKKMNKSVKIKVKEKSIKIGIGKENMQDEQLRGNIESAIKGVIELLPQKKDNVKDVLIKFTMTPVVKIKYD
jgi:large subunit ribosomal protein L1